jgi:hypothetical protein
MNPERPVEPEQPVDQQRSVDEQRVDLEELRGELGATAEELARRADVPARVRARRDETVAQARQAGVRLAEQVATRTTPVREAVGRSPAAAGAGAAALLGAAAVALSGRRSRKERTTPARRRRMIRSRTGHPDPVMRNLMAGVAAGAAGTTALNAVTYLDMTVRARPASTTPDETVRRVQELTGTDLGDADAAARRRSALGALLGIAAGLATGAAYGLVRPRVRRVPVAVLGVGAGLAANVGTTGPMAALGVTDPRTWPAGSWLSDLVPHLAYGLATAASFEAFRRRGRRR